jgi:hypothetical protein
MQQLQNVIESAFERRAEITPAVFASTTKVPLPLPEDGTSREPH